MTTDLEGDLAALAQLLRESAVAVRSTGGQGSGSGVIWSADGTIVTNAHVAQTASVEVELADGRRVRGIVDRRDEQRDLARVRVVASGLRPAAARDPHELRPGEFVAAFGHPLGVANVLSTGIVFAAYRGGNDRFVRADVRIAPGNSGGALADAQGRVIGINSMVAGGLALAIPSDAVRRFFGDALPARQLGVRLVPANLGDRRSAFAVVGVEPGSSAERSGLIIGDIVLTRDTSRLAAAQSLQVLRGGQLVHVAVADGGTESATAA